MHQNQSDTSGDGKLKYEKPAVTRIGTLENVTQWSGWAPQIDQAFPAGTLVSDMTFSDPPPK